MLKLRLRNQRIQNESRSHDWCGSILFPLTSSAAGTLLTFHLSASHANHRGNQPYQMTWRPKKWRWTSASMSEAEVDYGTSSAATEDLSALGLGSESDCRDSSGMRPTLGVGGGWRSRVEGSLFGGVQMVPLQLWRHEGDTKTECSARIKRQNGGLGGDR